VTGVRSHLPTVVTALAVLALVASGCDRQEGRPAGLVIQQRLTDGFTRPAGDGLTWGAWVRIGDEQRPAVNSGRIVITRAAWERDERMFAVAPLPDDVVASPWLFARLARMVSGTGRIEDPPVVIRGADASGRLRLGPFPDDRVADVLSVFADVTVAPELATRDLVSAPVHVPRGAELSVAYAVEEAAWSPDAAGVELTVTAVADEEMVLHRATLDPARRPDDRRWIEVRVPLAAVAGKDVRLRFAARAVAGAGAAASLPVWSEPVVLAPPAGDLPLGIVLVSLDTLRGLSTTSGGAMRPTTPRIDGDVGALGVTFENAITTSPHTLPAHVSMFTGRYLRSHGVRAPMASIAPEQRTLTEALHDGGWATAAFTEDGFVVPEVGIRRGFQQYRENKSANLHKPDGYAATIFDDGLRWLASHRDRPFFLFLHTYQVHLPYVPPAPYDTMFDPAAMLAMPEDVDLLRYEQEVRYVDDVLGVFLDGLASLGLRERTLVVVTADHGEEFMEHGRTTHMFQLYDEVARVPLMMRLPGFLPAHRGITTPVSLIDVAPTILDTVGLSPLPGADGQSLLPLVLDGVGRFPRDTVFAETISSFGAPRVDLIAVRQRGLSCIFRLYRGKSECFDRMRDPGERSPLRFAAGDTRMEEIRDLVSGFLQRGVGAAGGTPAVGVPDPERVEKLRALGYLE
jgi:hypothetical protein